MSGYETKGSEISPQNLQPNDKFLKHTLYSEPIPFKEILEIEFGREKGCIPVIYKNSEWLENFFRVMSLCSEGSGEIRHGYKDSLT